MKVSDFALGEIYFALDNKEIAAFSRFLNDNYGRRDTKLLAIHHKLVESIKSNESDNILVTDLITSVFQGNINNKSKTLFTTYTNILIQAFKEYLALTAARNKDLYSEFIWSKFIRNKGLLRNLRIARKESNDFIFEDRLDKLQIKAKDEVIYQLILSQKGHNENIVIAYSDYINKVERRNLASQLESYNLLCSYLIANNLELDEFLSVKIKSLIKKTKDFNDLETTMNALILDSSMFKNRESIELMEQLYYRNQGLFTKTLKSKFGEYILNYHANEYVKGSNISGEKLFIIYMYLHNQQLLIQKSANTHIQLGNFLTLALKYANIETCRLIVIDSIKFVQKDIRDSCERLCLARIAFKETDYKQAIFYLGSANPKDTFYYYPIIKAHLIKACIMLADDERVASERETFGKYLQNHEEVYSKDRFIAFHKYVDNLRESRYLAMSPTNRAKVEKILHDPKENIYEKDWMLERWQQLKDDHDDR